MMFRHHHQHQDKVTRSLGYYYYNYSATAKRIARMIMIYILNIALGVTHTKKAISEEKVWWEPFLRLFQKTL
jgi:hypothetical protein